MAPMKNGYDVDFIKPLPHAFKCSICHLAFRQPVKLRSCGHCFCKACFKTMEKHFNLVKQDMLCPLDQSVVHSHELIHDKDLEHKILSLIVRCSNNVKWSCRWTGPLRYHQSHLSKCGQRLTDAITENVREMSLNNSHNPPPFQDLSPELHEYLMKQSQKLDQLELKYTQAIEKQALNEKKIKNLETKVVQLESQVEVKERACLTWRATVNTWKEILERKMKKRERNENRGGKNDSCYECISKVGECIDELNSLESSVEEIKRSMVEEGKQDKKVELMKDPASMIAIKSVDARLMRLERMNPFSGFFAWTITNISDQRLKGSTSTKEITTSCFGFVCLLTLLWCDSGKSCASLQFEVKGKTPNTAPYLPFFCDLIVASVAKDGEVLSHRISYPNLTFVKSSETICYAEVKEFMRFPRDKKFFDNNSLRIFGYFTPFDPSI